MAGRHAGNHLAAGGLHGPWETEVLAALLAGARVCLDRRAMEYRRYRRTAPAGIYRRCLSLERRLREMGVCVIGTSGR